jgi:hypothetical protein
MKAMESNSAFHLAASLLGEPLIPSRPAPSGVRLACAAHWHETAPPQTPAVQRNRLLRFHGTFK